MYMFKYSKYLEGIKYMKYFLPLSRHGPGGRLGGRLPNLRKPYLGNRLTDFLNSKFYGIF